MGESKLKMDIPVELVLRRLVDLMDDGTGDAEVRMRRGQLFRGGLRPVGAVRDARVVRLGDQFDVERQIFLVVTIRDFDPIKGILVQNFVGLAEHAIVQDGAARAQIATQGTNAHELLVFGNVRRAERACV